MIVARVKTCLTSACCFLNHLHSMYTHNAFTYVYTLFISDLVLVKSVVVCILDCLGIHGHVAIIMKPSPHYILTKSTISGP